MLLVIDVGNSNTVVGLYDGEGLVADWRLTTTRQRTVDEMQMWFGSMLALKGYEPQDISGIALSSVVPALTGPLRTVADRMTGGPLVVVGPGTRTGMPILIDNPREVGADRVVNSVAAREAYGAPAIAVDFGTSTNFDVVGRGGEYLGGAIAPGLVIATEALVGGTAALRNVEYVPPRSPIGKGTVEAIQSGALYGHAGLVDGIVSRLAAEISGDGPPPTVVATGGLASTIVPHCRTVDVIDEHLTLDGLRLIYHLNQEDA